MIKQIEITNSSGEKFTLDLMSPDSSGLAIGSIDGLGPTKANINVTSSATTDISRYNSAHLDYRNVVFKFIFFEIDKSVENTRLKTYQMFPLKKMVHITVLTDNRYLCTDGYVESNEPAIFSEREGTSVSIICPDPFFYSELERNKDVTYNNVKKMFKFPFRTTETKKVIFGYITILPLQEITNLGDAEVGLSISFIIKGSDVINPFVMDYNKNQYMKILSSKVVVQEEGSEPVTGLLENDVVKIITVNSKKKVLLYRNNKEYNIIAALESYMTWLVLEKGINVYTFGADSGLDNLEINYEYTIVYEGV